jgi:hypothetical protein
MAMERRDPLPPGRYWLFLMPSEIGRWREWTETHRGVVKTVLVEPQLALAPHVPAIFATRPDLSIIREQAGDYVVFDVLSPVPWVGFGFPTIVPPGELPSANQVSSGPEPGDTDMNPLGALFGEAKTLALLAGATYLGAILLRTVLERRR